MNGLSKDTRILLCDRPWRIRQVKSVCDACSVLEIEALEDSEPRSLSVAVPPEEVTALPPAKREREIKDGDLLVTVPDFAWDEVKPAVFCDGFAYHGRPDTLALDAKKRNFLQAPAGWS